MPFTFSHAVAAIPLNRLGLSLSALIVGTLTPDLIYFLCLSTRCQFGHTVIGLFLFCLPAGLIILWIVHKLLKYPVLALLPLSHQQRLWPVARQFRFLPQKRLIAIMVSVLIGALTHVIWDAFTHSSGGFVRQWPEFFNTVVITTQLGDLKVYKFLQYASGVVGAALLVYFYFNWLKQAPKESTVAFELSVQQRVAIIIFMGLSTAVLAFSYGLFQISAIVDFYAGYRFIQYVVIAGIAVGFVELVVYSCLFWIIMGYSYKGKSQHTGRTASAYGRWLKPVVNQEENNEYYQTE